MSVCSRPFRKFVAPVLVATCAGLIALFAAADPSIARKSDTGGRHSSDKDGKDGKSSGSSGYGKDKEKTASSRSRSEAGKSKSKSDDGERRQPRKKEQSETTKSPKAVTPRHVPRHIPKATPKAKKPTKPPKPPQTGPSQRLQKPPVGQTGPQPNQGRPPQVGSLPNAGPLPAPGPLQIPSPLPSPLTVPLPAFLPQVPSLAFVPPQIPSTGPSGGNGGAGSLPPRLRQLPPRRPPSTVPPPDDSARWRNREVLVAMDDAVSDGDTIAIGDSLSLTVEVQYRSPLLGAKLVRLRIPDDRPAPLVISQVLQASQTDPRIIAVQPNYVFETAQFVPSSRATVMSLPRLPQYATEKVHLSAAHQVALGRDVRIAVIDTGLDAGHSELNGRIAASFDAVGDGMAGAEPHGTAIAGVVASHRQMRGIAPDASVLAVRAFAGTAARHPEATTLSVIKGLDWAALNNARVVNMSFAGPRDGLLQEAIEQAEARGLILVAAAGNGGPSATSAYPAAYDRVIAVTATDSDDNVYDHANRGTYIAVAAPGVDILAPAPDESYEVSSGTSLAAAHVSGIVALMLERQPRLTTDEVRRILQQTARDPDRKAAERGLGAGIVDAGKAVAEAHR